MARVGRILNPSWCGPEGKRDGGLTVPTPPACRASRSPTFPASNLAVQLKEHHPYIGQPQPPWNVLPQRAELARGELIAAHGALLDAASCAAVSVNPPSHALIVDAVCGENHAIVRPPNSNQADHPPYFSRWRHHEAASGGCGPKTTRCEGVSRNVEATSRDREASRKLFDMPLYQFELVGPDSATSLDGALLEDDDQAESIARSIADQARVTNPELIAQDYQIVVTDELGNEIVRIPFEPAQ
jgi:hypothetical protein